MTPTAPEAGLGHQPRPHDARMRMALVAVASCAAVLSLGTLAFAGARPGLSALLGGLLAITNLWTLSKIIPALLPRNAGGAGAQSRAAWGLVAMLKLALLLAITWLLLRKGLAMPLPLLVGFVSLPMGIAIGSLLSDRSAV
jgi:hypothetical protein